MRFYKSCYVYYIKANIVLFLFFFVSCKKLVEISPPPTKPDANIVYSNNATAISVLTGLYNRMSSGNGNFVTGNSSISLISGLTADEFVAYSTSGSLQLQAYKNSLTSTNVPFWSNLYNYIYTTNTAIEGLTSSNNLTLEVKQQLVGEAKFLRAFFYFYLVSLWGDVPLITTTDYELNGNASRTSRAEVWQQIVNDLEDAKDLLSNNFVDIDLKTPSNERIRPNRWAAVSLLARVYLYQDDNVNAERYSSEVINSNLFDTVSVDQVFLKNSKEAIWQLQPVNPGWNTEDARGFILTSSPNFAKPVSLSNVLLSSFEFGDLRRIKWVDSISIGSSTYYYPVKYKSATQNSPITEYLMVLRIAEQYLIRAEARIKQGKILEAQEDLNVIRLRSRLPKTSANNRNSLVSAILNERQAELFTEWGHRWLDLKRSDKVDSVMNKVAPYKVTIWKTEMKLYPIPLSDILKNPKLEQNLGY